MCPQTGGAAAAAPGEEGAAAADDAAGFEEEEGGKYGRLTLMEEVLLLGLKVILYSIASTQLASLFVM